jgi:hypothetical protein
MSRIGPPFPCAEFGLAVHLRLRDHDATAATDLCQAYLNPLLGWLEGTYPSADGHFRQSAVHDALLTYLENPSAYDPSRLDLAAYLRMAARGDLFNLLRAEGRHRQRQNPWSVVEDGGEAGNLLGREEEPSQRLERLEEEEQWQARLRSVAQRFTATERRVLELMLAGERAVAAYAAVLGLEGLPITDPQREVKRLKDRIKKRLEREVEKHE